MIREGLKYQGEDDDYKLKTIKRTLPCLEIWSKFNQGRKVWCGWEGEDFNLLDLELVIKDFDFVGHSRFNRTHAFSMFQHEHPRFVFFRRGDGSEEEMHFEHTLLLASTQFNKFEAIIACMKDVSTQKYIP
jgi:hypothetical protein